MKNTIGKYTLYKNLFTNRNQILPSNLMIIMQNTYILIKVNIHAYIKS